MKNNFCDEDMMKDLLSSQKFVTDAYNTSANESATPTVLSDFMNILRDEHQIQNDVFSEMQTRGWYPTEPADQNKISEAKQKYSAQ